MAENSPNESSSGPGAVSNNFNKGMLKDYNETFVGEGLYTHARNAVNNSHDGQVGVIGNEPSNLKCIDLPYELIGAIHTIDDIWILFTTNDIDSEIGEFDESRCTYKTIVNAPCLNFKRTNLITGAFSLRFACDKVVYWDDGLNPSRYLNIDDVPYIYTDRLVNGCIQRTFTDELDCERLRLASLIQHPCLKLEKGKSAGTLPNGSYQACIAYSVGQTRVTDYIGLSEVQGLFQHENVSSSLELTISKIDKNFDEFELVIVSNINGQAVCKRIGYYPTTLGVIYIDRWDLEYVTVPISEVVLRTDAIDKSDAMYPVNNYLLRVGVYSKYKFNYQLQANKIKTKWVAVEYPATYYINGGNNPTFMRDEQYAFFIRWIYNTGERSESYHIPGRISESTDTNSINNEDSFETADGLSVKRWQIENTATVDSILGANLADGGRVIASGKMGYWQSTEKYPADTPEIWGALCGQPIRHHKFPDETVDPILSPFSNGGNNIVLLGVQFEGITHPLDQNGNPINSIVGYEILRGSREGAKSIVAKGMFNNMRTYNVPGNPTQLGLFQNYPYNDLRADPFLTSVEQTGENGNKNDKPNSPPLSGYRKDIFSFHSPEVSFSFPYLNLYEAKIYQEINADVRGTFEVPYQHPQFRLITNGFDTTIDVLVVAITAAEAVSTFAGAYTKEVYSNPNLPPLKLGIGSVLAEGVQGTLGQVLQVSAAVVNAGLQSAYTILFGSRVAKEQLLGMVLTLIPFRQFAAQYNSHGLYNSTEESVEGNRRRKVLDANYVGSSIQQFTGEFQVNNVNRSKFLIVRLNSDLQDPTTKDNSRFLLGPTGKTYSESIDSTASSYYGAVKIAIPSQYGQLESIKQIVISNCVFNSVPILNNKVNTSVIFGGDCYINRFTEKNSFFYFSNWLQNEPNGTEYNYALYPTLPYPKYWLNSTKYIGLFADKASEYRSLDTIKKNNFFFIEKGYFYLFNSGVRDFFVESEINLAYRDWDEPVARQHYDPARFTDLNLMFRSDIIKSGNYYKYDYSLSITKLFNSNITWGNILPRDYDPETYSRCYTYQPNRAIYSLPQQEMSTRDNWRVFLANNYKDFLSRITAIKPINKTGALFMMGNQSPMQFMGTEELKLDGTGAKVTIGDGELFSDTRQLQNIVNADVPFEYGSCQNRLAIISTGKGVFWVSQNQGKVFNYAGQGLNEISNAGLKYWFAKYLPSEILKVYPDYPMFDNPLVGIGVSLIYDNTNEILYVTKRDYKPVFTNMQFDESGKFIYNGAEVSFTDPDYFENACWTISYDTKSQTWISFHDWIPTFLLPSRIHFLSVDKDTMWKHNVRCDSYCNFYGVDYPFEIEFVSATGQQVTSMRSIEYLLEAYRYYNDCRDKFHVLDANFDEAMVYNSEQISGILNLYLKDKTNPLQMLTFPRITATSIDINYSKEEQKYRFNQFWDITKDRGEFSGTSAPIILTEPNGYKYKPNDNYVDYNKSPLQRKKFRHNVNRVWLSKRISGDLKYLFKISNQKIFPSYR